jgi:hypothetical protein
MGYSGMAEEPRRQDEVVQREEEQLLDLDRGAEHYGIVKVRLGMLAAREKATTNSSLHPCISYISIHRCSKPHRTGAVRGVAEG